MTASAPSRRDRLLAVAADLFAARGYHAVGIDDIGAAAGISGPGVYRHFAGKQALLAALCGPAMERMLTGAERLVAGAADPRAALLALVDQHAAFAVDERALLSVWAREQRALDEGPRRALRGQMRAYEQVWHGPVARLREDLDGREVALAVSAALALLNSTALTEASAPRERTVPLLRHMALAALLVRELPGAG